MISMATVNTPPKEPEFLPDQAVLKTLTNSSKIIKYLKQFLVKHPELSEKDARIVMMRITERICSLNKIYPVMAWYWVSSWKKRDPHP